MNVKKLGCRYNLQLYADRNGDRIQKALDDGVSHLVISNKLYVEGEISHQVGEDWNSKNALHIEGRGNASIVGLSSGVNPILSFKRVGTPSILIENLYILSDSSGIALDTPGASTILRNLRITARGEGELDTEDWTDVDWSFMPNKPLLGCSYGLWINNADGGHLDNVCIYNCSGHGLIATRWHDTHSHIGQIHNCRGCGFKGERINGGNIDIRCESNGGYGLYLKRCCERANAWPAQGYHHPSGSTTRMMVWVENNNNRGKQIKLDRCGDMILEGETKL